jgi:uncharacterized membrane protein YecN with MAPEG domain
MIISLYAGILTLIYVGLSAYVIKGRFQHKVSLGDNNNPDLQKRMRVHGNFIEYVPLAVFMIFMMEILEVSPWVVHLLGALLIIARGLHIYGLINKDGASLMRAAGTMMTFAVLVMTALYNIYFFLFA